MAHFNVKRVSINFISRRQYNYFLLERIYKINYIYILNNYINMKIQFTRFAFGNVGLRRILASSCSKKPGTGGRSAKTGVPYNDKYNGGLSRCYAKTHPAPGPGLVTIEGGTFVLRRQRRPGCYLRIQQR